VVRILFVGADLDRKGGTTLLAAFGKLRAHLATGAAGTPAVELHLVTKTPVTAAPGVFVHPGMTPNAAPLLDLYRRCHVFCLPTRADMLALVLCEAGAAGLPLVSTAVGGIREIVRDGETGLLVPPDDVEALTTALTLLVEEPSLRRRLGAQAAALVSSDFDAATNARRIVDLLKQVSQRGV
jgi:glycosyltransferase involved in cell wall biosynthesis